MAVLHREKPDRIPWLIYSCLLPRGSMERELRNMGLGLCEHTGSVYEEEAPNVTVERRKVGDILSTTCHTPVGSVSYKERMGIDVAGFAYSPGGIWPRGWGGLWITDYMIKDLSDYNVVKFMVEDTVYRPNYKPLLDAERNVGGDGVVRANVGHSPLQRLLIQIMGFKRFFIDFYKHPKEVEELLRSVDEKYKELEGIVADSPAEIVMVGDNIDGMIIGPKLFEKYCVPFYNRWARLLHREGKLVGVHMDGRLKCLLNSIPKAEIDFIEAFTPPPMGNLPLTEAKAAWRDKYIIWINFPASICLLGYDEVKKYTLETLNSIAPGDGFILGVTEDIPPSVIERSLKTITEVILEHGNYPISPA